MTQDRPKRTPRWSICTRWPRDGRRWPQNGPNWSLKTTPEWCSRVGEVQILLNRLCRRRSSPRNGPRRPHIEYFPPMFEYVLHTCGSVWPYTDECVHVNFRSCFGAMPKHQYDENHLQDDPKWFKMGPRSPQHGFKMAPRCFNKCQEAPRWPNMAR